MTPIDLSRQSFLGNETMLTEARVGIVGLGGGGSHAAQQLAHLGVRHFAIYDSDTMEATNLNRLVGGTTLDVAMKMPKTMISERVIRGVTPEADVARRPMRWQDDPAALRACNIVFGCVDTYRERWELQVFSRRFLIPYVDVGLDILSVNGERPQMRGQVIVTVPGGPCMKCIHFLDDEALEKEAARYGDTGGRPQVVWANGVLASTAVGLAVDVLTGWAGVRPPLNVIYLSYDGNAGTLAPDKRLKYVAQTCRHFGDGDVGEPVWNER
jgi:hypothetical protein